MGRAGHEAGAVKLMAYGFDLREEQESSTVMTALIGQVR